MRNALVRLAALLTAAVMVISGLAWLTPPARAEDVAQVDQEIKYIAPQLSSDAPPYDPTHPENHPTNPHLPTQSHPDTSPH